MADKYNPGRSSPSRRLPALLLLIHLLCSMRAAHGDDFPTEAGLSTRWTSTPVMQFSNESQLRPGLVRPLWYTPRVNNSYAYEYIYACGFYCRGACSSFLFAIVVVPDFYPVERSLFLTADHQVVWAANRDRPVRENATLQLGSDGDLVLTDADGTKVWSSGTSGKPVAGLNLTESGNLVLFGDDKNKSIWWESFAHPTDSLLPGQKIRVGHSLNTVYIRDGSQVWPVLLRPLMYLGDFTGAYACGFYCSGACDSFLFAVVVVPDFSTSSFQRLPQLVWAANRDRPVRENATLQLGSDGDLVLTDADGLKVWSSGTSGKPVAGLNLTESGNLVLFGGDKNKSIWWESFAHPTDSLLPGQKLRVGQSLNTVYFRDGSKVWPVLLRPLMYLGDFTGAYACGFYCSGACDSFLFAALFVQDFWTSQLPQVVWVANRDRPVRENATLQLGSDGDLVLSDADGTKVWSSGTSGKPVAGLNLTESGHLVLFGGDKNKSIWWESTDSLLPGQKLRFGQSLNTVYFRDGSQVWPVLLRLLMYLGDFTGAYACGFYCSGACDSFLFAVVVVPSFTTSSFQRFPQLVWAANRDRPVRENATLQLGSDGDLVLTDADGTKVWSSGTSGMPVAGLNLTESGNLVLFGGDKNKSIWWESFAHPTDSLHPGQKLRVGQTLKANDSPTNFTEGLYYLSATSSEVVDAFIKSDPPTSYASYESQTTDSKNVGYFEFVNWSVSNFTSPGNSDYIWPLQFLRLESDGHLRHYRWISESFDWSVVSDLLTSTVSTNCFYPTVCGRYGICSVGEQCSCPQQDGDDDDNGRVNYFVPVDRRDPKSGCKPVIPFSCGNPSTTHRLLRFENVFCSFNLSSVTTDEDGCRTLCENNCSCRAAFYYPIGCCYLTSEVFSLRRYDPDFNTKVAFIKVQNPPSPSHSQKTRVVILVPALGSLFLLLVCMCSCCILVLKKKRILREKEMDAEDEEEDLEQVLAKRFSLEELRVATGDFGKKLGQGGFGSVYEGRIDEKSMAVKRLDGAGQRRNEFLAEVQTLGKIHHVNLVKLVGYCAEKSCRLLVYEFMPNGSLDRWIFSAANPLDWQTRCKILLGVAKGISYLHEDCSQKIVHLDIKPQNILLDDRFEAKVSDFGLAKLIDRDLTHVVTRMRGTLGYLAPEWVSSGITEKVDVYSFGVVVLETVCGRRNLDRSQPEEDALLVNLLKRKAENGELLDVVDESIKNAGFHNEEAMKMFKIAMWCLQDKNKRPSMSTVVKALESGLDVETIFLTSTLVGSNVAVDVFNSAPMSPSLLSAPR